MYFIYVNKFNIIIPRYMYTYSCTVPPNGYYLDLWHLLILLLQCTMDVLCQCQPWYIPTFGMFALIVCTDLFADLTDFFSSSYKYVLSLNVIIIIALSGSFIIRHVQKLAR